MIIRFVANASSPHVRSWVRALSPVFDIAVYDIARGQSHLVPDLEVEVKRPLRATWFRHLKIVQYILLGLWLRKQKFRGILHSHNTSGYGLSAWISGKTYIVTTYGSEIYQASKRGPIYRWMIGRVLSGSVMITASAPFMARTLEDRFSVPPSKIFCKMLVDQIFVDAGTTTKQMGVRTWFVNRRMTALYCTLDVVIAFRMFLQAGGRGNLVILEGDADPEFARGVDEAAAGEPSIRIVRGFVDQTEMIQELKAAHFVISVPVSDQLSSAIVEAAACQAVPIVRNLPSYKPVESICVTLAESGSLVNDLVDAFNLTASMAHEELVGRGAQARKFVLDRCSPEDFRNEFSRRVCGLS